MQKKLYWSPCKRYILSVLLFRLNDMLIHTTFWYFIYFINIICIFIKKYISLKSIHLFLMAFFFVQYRDNKVWIKAIGTFFVQLINFIYSETTRRFQLVHLSYFVRCKANTKFIYPEFFYSFDIFRDIFVIKTVTYVHNRSIWFLLPS